MGTFAPDTALASTAAHLAWWSKPALLGHNAQTPAKQGVRGVSPLSLVERLKNAREAAKLKWNTEWGRAWRKAYNASPRGRAAAARHYGTSLYWSTLRRWREANRELIRSYEKLCRQRYRINLQAAKTALDAGALPINLPEPQRRALARRANEVAREKKRCAKRSADNTSFREAEAAGVAEEDMTPDQKKAKRAAEMKTASRQRLDAAGDAAAEALKAGAVLTEEEQAAYDRRQDLLRKNRERTALWRQKKAGKK